MNSKDSAYFPDLSWFDESDMPTFYELQEALAEAKEYLTMINRIVVALYVAAADHFNRGHFHRSGDKPDHIKIGDSEWEIERSPPWLAINATELTYYWMCGVGGDLAQRITEADKAQADAIDRVSSLQRLIRAHQDTPAAAAASEEYQ